MMDTRETNLAKYASELERLELGIEQDLEHFNEHYDFVQKVSRLVEEPETLAAIAADPEFASVVGRLLRLPLQMITLDRHRRRLQEQRNVES